MKHRYVHRVYARMPMLRRLAMGILSRVELAALGGHKERAVLRLIRQVRSERESLLSANEAFMLHALARAQSALPGAMAEVGSIRGVRPS